MYMCLRIFSLLLWRHLDISVYNITYCHQNQGTHSNFLEEKLIKCISIGYLNFCKTESFDSVRKLAIA